jgi:hypothetical protein
VEAAALTSRLRKLRQADTRVEGLDPARHGAARLHTESTPNREHRTIELFPTRESLHLAQSETVVHSSIEPR